MEKIDLAKQYKTYYSAKDAPQQITVKAARFLSLTGKGDPCEAIYTEKIEALYAIAYNIKFACKAIGKDFVIAKLEGIWSFNEQEYGEYEIFEMPLKVPRSEWSYRMMIRLPDYVSESHIAAAIDNVIKKKNVSFVKDIALYSIN